MLGVRCGLHRHDLQEFEFCEACKQPLEVAAGVTASKIQYEPTCDGMSAKNTSSHSLKAGPLRWAKFLGYSFLCFDTNRYGSPSVSFLRGDHPLSYDSPDVGHMCPRMCLARAASVIIAALCDSKIILMQCVGMPH